MKLAAAVALAVLVPLRVASATADAMPPVVWECASGVIVVEAIVRSDARPVRAGCAKASPAVERAALRAIEAWQPAIDRMPPTEPEVPCPVPALVRPNCAFTPIAGDAPSPCRPQRPAAA